MDPVREAPRRARRWQRLSDFIVGSCNRVAHAADLGRSLGGRPRIGTRHQDMDVAADCLGGGDGMAAVSAMIEIDP